MSLHDKIRCLKCSHPQHKHTGNHRKGYVTICRHPQCECLSFEDQYTKAADELISLTEEMGLYDCGY